MHKTKDEDHVTWGSRILISVVIFVLIGCHESEPNYHKPLEVFHPKFMLYPSYQETSPSDPIHVVYDGKGNPVKISGGFLDDNGLRIGVYSQIFDSLVYNYNLIMITRDDIFPTYDLPVPFKRTIVTSDSKITMIIKPTYSTNGLVYQDTIFFNYDAAGQIEKTVEKRWRVDVLPAVFRAEETKLFHFIDGNLSTIKGTRKTRLNVITHTTETFEGYDNAFNPTYKLGMIEEIFYRSVSKNNFTRYFFQRTNDFGEVIDATSKEWTFSYDAHGVPTFL
jgi:hypothetical protein